MLFSPSVILEKVENDFVRSYESFSGFPRSGNLWDECLKTVQDATLMNHIIFNNDVMEIPPVRTFLKANDVLEGGFTSYQKKALAAFWEFVFKDVFFYGGQEDNVGVSVMGIRKGARFTSPPQDIMVGELDEATGKILLPIPRRRLRMKLADPVKTDISAGPILHDTEEPHEGSSAQRPVGLRISDPDSEAKIADDSRLENRRLDDSRLENERRDDSRLENERTDDSGLEDSGLERQRSGNESPEIERFESDRLEDHQLEAERFENERLREQRLEIQRLEDESLEKRRLDDENPDRQRTEGQRVDDERLEIPRDDDSSY